MTGERKWSWAIAIASALGIAAGALAALEIEPEAVRESAGEFRGLVSELELDAEQQDRVEELRRSELPGVEKLRQALAQIEGRLRRAELARPFDAERVNELVAEQAELLAYLRGSESRVVAQIAQLLTAEQGLRFERLRSEGRTPMGAADLPRRAPDPQFF